MPVFTRASFLHREGHSLPANVTQPRKISSPGYAPLDLKARNGAPYDRFAVTRRSLWMSVMSVRSARREGAEIRVPAIRMCGGFEVGLECRGEILKVTGKIPDPQSDMVDVTVRP